MGSPMDFGYMKIDSPTVNNQMAHESETCTVERLSLGICEVGFYLAFRGSIGEYIAYYMWCPIWGFRNQHPPRGIFSQSWI